MTINVDQDGQQAIVSFPRYWIAMIFVLLTLFITLDEFRYPETLGLSSSNVATVPLFNAWTIGWNADRFANRFADYWNAPIFFPAHNSFAFSEPQPATLLVSPIVLATGSFIVGYKAYLVLSLFLNGLFAALLLSRLGYHWTLQILGGIGILLLPIIHERIDVIQLLPVWGILWFWSSLFELMERPSFSRSVWLGLSYAVCFTLCIHHSLFLTILTTLSSVVFLPKLFNWNRLLWISIAVLMGSLMVLPLVLPIHKATKEHNFSRQEELVIHLSAHPVDYLNSQSNSVIKFAAFEGSPSRQFCVGWIKMLLAIVGLISGIITKQRRQWILFLFMTGLFAFFLSLGPSFHIGELNPWQLLSRHSPGMSQVRSAYRFAWFVQIAVAFLAIEGLRGLFQFYVRYKSRRSLQLSLGFLLLILSILFVGETWPEKTVRADIPAFDKNEKWIEYLRTNKSQQAAIACFPFANGKLVNDFEKTTRWMCYGLKHETPMVNGYSGFFPEEYLRIAKLFENHDTEVAGIERLSELGVSHLVVSQQYSTSDVMLRLKSPRYSLEHVFADQSAAVDIYRLDVTELE